MEDMAAMLNEMAGGLQQSFGSVFERVGQSLSQSAEMMQMMNEMMETALLQSLVATCEASALPTDNVGDTTSASTAAVNHDDDMHEASAAKKALMLTVSNQSQIFFAEAVVTVSTEQTEKQVVQASIADWQPQTQRVIALPEPMALVDHAILVDIAVRSPGTQEWLHKKVSLRIPFIGLGVVQVVRFQDTKEQDGATTAHESVCEVHSDKVSLRALRELMRVDPFEALVTSDMGYYRFQPPTGAMGACGSQRLRIVIEKRGASATGARVVVSAPSCGSPQSTDAIREQCACVLEELEPHQ